MPFLVNEKFNKEAADAVNVAVIIGTAGSGALAEGGATAAWATFDIAFSATALTVDSYKTQIGGTEAGKTFLQGWETFNKVFLAYMVLKLSAATFKVSVNTFKTSWQSYKTSGGFINFKSLNPSAAGRLENEMETLFKEAEKAEGASVVNEAEKAEVAIKNGVFDELLSNENLSNIYNLYKTGKRKLAYAELTIEQEALINHYSKYSAQLRAGDPSYYAKYKTAIDGALESLNTKYSGTVYSGQNFSDEIIKNFKKGNYFEFNDLLSSSSKLDVAKDFLKHNNGNVLLEIESYSGRQIEKASSFSKEIEVLFESEAAYQVKDVRSIPNPVKPSENILYVILEQM